MITSFRSEWLLLNRARLWLVAGLTTIAFTVVATAISTATAKPGGRSFSVGLTTQALAGHGGLTAGVIWSIAFGSILLLAAFASVAASEFSRGTFRTALLHHPGRWSLVAGKIAARIGVTAILFAAAMVCGAITAAIVAPANGLSTAGWYSASGFADAGADFARLLAWALGWAIFGTAIAVLVRSTPIALAVGVLWFGPIENVVGDGRHFAQRWFPGQLLRALVTPGATDVTSTGTAAVTLTGYAAICLAVVGIVLSRRTSRPDAARPRRS